MSTQSLIERNRVFFSASALTAHANGYVHGFRQRDVKFFIELFTNYVDPTSEWEEFPLQNTHVSRYLDSLVAENYAKKIPRKVHPTYRLNRIGVIEVMANIVQQPYYDKPAYFFFAYSFVENYTARMHSMIKLEGEKFPYALQLEIESLLDLDALLQRQVEATNREIKTLERRVEEQLQTHLLVEKRLEEGAPFSRIAGEVEKHFPYSLNTKKPFTELLAQGTEKQAIWELTVGGPRRCQQQWQPAIERLQLHLEQLQRLGESSKLRRAGKIK